MRQDYNHPTQLASQAYIISPSFEQMQVPVLREPNPYSDTLAYLTAETAIEVVSKSNYWLYILLPNKVQGYIYAAYARPATRAELAALRRANVSVGRSEDLSAFSPMQVGFTAGAIHFLLKVWVFVRLFVLSILLFASGFFVGRGIVHCTAGSSCTYPFESLGALITFLGFFVLIFAICTFVVELARSFHKR